MPFRDFTLRGILCEKTQEAIDEVRMHMEWDAATHRPFAPPDASWGPVSLNDGDARSIGWTQRFYDRMAVSVFEHDRVGPDDPVGTIGAAATDPTGNFDALLDGSRARYRVFYSLSDQPGSDLVLHLNGLECLDAQERTDEPYLVVNGECVWGPGSMRTHDDQAIRREITFGRNETLTVELWERDPARSERIGDRLTVDIHDLSRPADPDDQVLFRGARGIPGDATYRLRYRVSERR